MTSEHDLENIETMLRQMPLVKPSERLDARVMAARPHPKRAWLVGAFGGALAAAAAVILAVGLPQITRIVPVPKPVPGPVEVAGGAPQAAPGAPVQPVKMQQNWSELSYEGLVLPDPQTPMQAFRHRTVDRYQFVDPQRNIRMETTVPREEIIFVKAPMQ